MNILKISADLNIEDIEIVDECLEGYDSLYSLILDNAKSDSLILIDNKIAYVDSIRADYLNHQLYVPMFNCDIITEGNYSVTYNNRMEKVVIHDFKSGYTIENMYIIPSIISKQAYKVQLNTLKLSVSNPNTSARDLFMRYIASSYWYTSEDTTFKYNIVQKKNISAKQRELLVKNGLHFYGEKVDMTYRDVRNWKLEVLSSKFSEAELLTNEHFNIRRLQFELELYTRLYDKIYWDGWSFGSLEMLLNNKYDYIKYKENGVYLIFKSRWLGGF